MRVSCDPPHARARAAHPAPLDVRTRAFAALARVVLPDADLADRRPYVRMSRRAPALQRALRVALPELVPSLALPWLVPRLAL